MPRKLRRRSKTGIYHIILRGVNKQTIFQDDEDRSYFIEKLEKYSSKYKFKIYAYCLMDNHIHAVIDEKDEGIDRIVKRISASYVYYYNNKYERCGHLFQERYKSETVEEERYFFILIRYIHQNPIKAGIVNNVEDYKWSSYKEYISKPRLVDVKFYLEMIDNNECKAIEKYKDFMKERGQEECLEYSIKLTDVEAIKQIKQKCGDNIIEEIQRMSTEEQEKVVRYIKEIKGISIRQIVRITRNKLCNCKKITQGSCPLVFLTYSHHHLNTMYLGDLF